MVFMSKGKRTLILEMDIDWFEGNNSFMKYLKGWHRGTILKIKLIRERKQKNYKW